MQVTNYVIERLQLDVPPPSLDGGGGASEMHSGTASSNGSVDMGQPEKAPGKVTKVEVLCNDQVRQEPERAAKCRCNDAAHIILVVQMKIKGEDRKHW